MPNGQPYGLCPQEAQSLTNGDVNRIEKMALYAVPLLLDRNHKGEMQIDTEDAVAGAELGSHATTPGADASDCGPLVQRRTAVVTISFPRMQPSASLGSATFYFSKEARGWVIWNWPS